MTEHNTTLCSKINPADGLVIPRTRIGKEAEGTWIRTRAGGVELQRVLIRTVDGRLQVQLLEQRGAPATGAHRPESDATFHEHLKDCASLVVEACAQAVPTTLYADVVGPRQAAEVLAKAHTSTANVTSAAGSDAAAPATSEPELPTETEARGRLPRRLPVAISEVEVFLQAFTRLAMKTGHPQLAVALAPERRDPALEEGGTAAILKGLSRLGDFLRELGRIEKRAATLEIEVLEARRSAETAHKDLEDFGYGVAHVICNRLSKTESMSLQLSGLLPPHKSSIAARIYESMKSAQNELRSLFEIQCIGRARLQYERIDLTEIVSKIAAQMKEAVAGRHLEFRIAKPAHAVADRRLLTSALEELFTNAVKFTRQRPVAVIEFLVRQTVQGNEFIVSDNGIGFDRDFSRWIFGTARQLDRNKENGGSGLGLSRVKKIIERHDGRIWARGSPGEGAAFHFVLGQAVREDSA